MDFFVNVCDSRSVMHPLTTVYCSLASEGLECIFSPFPLCLWTASPIGCENMILSWYLCREWTRCLELLLWSDLNCTSFSCLWNGRILTFFSEWNSHNHAWKMPQMQQIPIPLIQSPYVLVRFNEKIFLLLALVDQNRRKQHNTI